MRPRTWAPHHRVVVAIAVVAILAASAHSVALTLFGAPTAVVAALFVFADRRSPLIGATMAAIAYLRWAGAAASLTTTDVTSALGYAFVSLHGVLAAAMGGFAMWIADVVLRNGPVRGSSSIAPYR